MKDIIQMNTARPSASEPRRELEAGFEDGFSLSHRSVLTETLPPARWAPMPRRRPAALRPEDEDIVLLPF